MAGVENRLARQAVMGGARLQDSKEACFALGRRGQQGQPGLIDGHPAGAADTATAANVVDVAVRPLHGRKNGVTGLGGQFDPTGEQ